METKKAQPAPETVAQGQLQAQNMPYDVVEQMPQFPGGTVAMMKYLSTNIRYPETAHQAGQQGRVIANFIVEKDGSITEAKIVRSVSPELDAEALRVVNAMPRWTPGTQDGKAVRVKYTIPISFQLQGNDQPAATTVKSESGHGAMTKVPGAAE